tara:strand:- start:34 stop:300 length:267 start_codon:yes stop_codon:yes gene_type:complete
MNRKEAEKIQPGALVRWSFTEQLGTRKGIVLAKRFERGEKRENVLCLVKPFRYILTVHWLASGPPHNYTSRVIDEISSWDLMVVSHAT